MGYDRINDGEGSGVALFVQALNKQAPKDILLMYGNIRSTSPMSVKLDSVPDLLYSADIVFPTDVTLRAGARIAALSVDHGEHWVGLGEFGSPTIPAEIADLKRRISAAEGNIRVLQGDVANLKSRVQTLENNQVSPGAFAALGDRVKKLEDK
jgi:hypothetical protein